jgi:FdhD protein
VLWRREWDSNPRYGFPYTRFPSVRLKPLGHPSVRLRHPNIAPHGRATNPRIGRFAAVEPLPPARAIAYIRHMTPPKDDYLIRPDPLDPRLTERVAGVDQTGQAIETRVTVERALTIFLNSQEIVTAMTINDYPEYLALGYLLNQHMLLADDVITGVDYDEELALVVVRTKRKTNYEKKLKKKVQTSGCAQGTVFGDLMEALENVTLPKTELRTSWLYALTHKINTTPSLYLEAGAIHGCVLAHEDKPLVYMEDVGRHNAVDKIAGWMFQHGVPAHDKIFYTTGRLTSEMVIKTVRMGIPILVSRSGFTAWGVELARKANLTLVGRARGKRFVALAGEARIVFDQDLDHVEEESARHQRKAAVHDD